MELAQARPADKAMCEERSADCGFKRGVSGDKEGNSSDIAAIAKRFTQSQRSGESKHRSESLAQRPWLPSADDKQIRINPPDDIRCDADPAENRKLSLCYYVMPLPRAARSNCKAICDAQLGTKNRSKVRKQSERKTPQSFFNYFRLVSSESRALFSCRASE